MQSIALPVPMSSPSKFQLPSRKRMLLRALMLRCPHCGGRGIFETVFTLKKQCPTCGLRTQRGEDDYFVGAYLFNLCMVEAILWVGAFACIAVTYPNTPWTALTWVTGILMIVGCFACYPFAKTTWLAVDLSIRPLTKEELDWHGEDGAFGDRVLPHI